MARYSPIVGDHFFNPRNAGPLPDANCIGKADINGHAPRVTISLRVAEGHIRSASFQTFGCGITIAAASMVTELVCGKQVDTALALTPAALSEALGGLPGDRRHCAEVVVRALHDAVDQWQNPKAGS